MISNCFIHAIHRFVTKGGWLIMRRSHVGPYPHFIHADHLPEDLPVSQFVAHDDKYPLAPLFRGSIMRQLGEIKPPPVRGKFDGVLFIFWASYMAGIAALFSLFF